MQNKSRRIKCFTLVVCKLCGIGKNRQAETLKQLGVTSAFDESADFSGITDGIAYIDDILQETHIAIDEKGVTASAFTQIDYTGAMRPEGRADMTLNRPFIFGIQHSGTLLFIGICDNPAK